MKVQEILVECRQRRVVLSVVGRRLRYSPTSAVSDDLMAELRAHKSEILYELRRDPQCDCRDLVSAEDNEFYWTQVSANDLAYLTGRRRWPGPCVFCGGRLVHSEECRDQQRDWRLSVPMPWGKHRGVSVKDVRADYLRWFYYNADASEEIRDAIREQLNSRITSFELPPFNERRVT